MARTQTLQLITRGLTTDPTRRQVHVKQQYLVRTKTGTLIACFDDIAIAQKYLLNRAERGVTGLRLTSQTTTESDLDYDLEEIANAQES